MTFSFMFGPMLPLARGIAIFDEHTRLARFETDNDAPLLAVASPRGAALGTDAIVVLAPHPNGNRRRREAHFEKVPKSGPVP